MDWQDKILYLVNYNDFVRMIVIFAIIIIIMKATTNPQSIIRSILISIFGVFGVWIILNIDYVLYKIFH